MNARPDIMTDDTLLSRLDEQGVLTVTLNRPESRNALTPVMQRRIVEALQAAARDPDVRVVVLTGAGNAFCAGADVRSMGTPDPDDPIAQQRSDQPVWGQLEARVDRLRRHVEASVLLNTMGKPTIAMLRGPAAGAGLSMALACDFRIAAESAVLVPAFAKIGVSGDYGAAYFLTSLVGPSRAKELLMFGDRIDARRALDLGIVNRLVDDDAIDAETADFARRLARGPGVALRYIKENVRTAIGGSMEHALEVETRNMIRCLTTEDARAAVLAFREKRDPEFRGY